MSLLSSNFRASGVEAVGAFSSNGLVSTSHLPFIFAQQSFLNEEKNGIAPVVTQVSALQGMCSQEIAGSNRVWPRKCYDYGRKKSRKLK
jgi:hypothetical protein